MTATKLYIVTKDNRVMQWVDSPCDSNEAFRGTEKECLRFAFNVRSERFEEAYEAHIEEMRPGPLDGQLYGTQTVVEF